MRGGTALASVVGVLAALLVAAPASAATTITGDVTARDGGAPIVGAVVEAITGESDVVKSATTDATGHYQLIQIPTSGTFRLRFRAAGFAELWSANAPDWRNAARYSGTVQQFVNAALYQGAGTIRGTITDFTGQPLAGATILVQRKDTSWRAYTRTDATGGYTQGNVPPGEYSVKIYAARHAVQYVPAQALPSFFTVADAAEVVADDTMLPNGGLDLAIQHPTTGAPVADACITVTGTIPVFVVSGEFPPPSTVTGTVCARADGHYRFDDLPPVEYTVTMTGSRTYWPFTAAKVTPARGAPTAATITAAPAASVRLRISAAQSGVPVPTTCVQFVPLPFRTGESGIFCNLDPAGAPQAELIIGPLQNVDANLFVAPAPGSGLGAQWLSPIGGTGDQRLAAALKVGSTGVTADVPAIVLDPAGEIKGRMTGFDGADPIGCAFPVGMGLSENGKTGLPGHTYGCDTLGTYTIAGLGPYRWPIQFVPGNPVWGQTYSPIWSGRANNRFAASHIKVTAGASVTVDAVFPAQKSVWVVGTDDYTTSMALYDAYTGDPVLAGGFNGSISYRRDAFVGATNLILYRDGKGTCWMQRPVTVGRRSTLEPYFATGITQYLRYADCRSTPPPLRKMILQRRGSTAPFSIPQIIARRS
ncbi:hypothetical protein F4553_004766 [Allocatelliglobosispora scoriae]|uniref:Alpha-amylase n=1 Tax=Allocatelliglobosispora scoriae TaxID=643052 RepID=A0A841BQR0_9ACTN|nr:carboxypeptidase-like regulatory domain-containing protein [Allocatelliglobosispora scoriae]MBB5871387.1 hypothetical protein [Allocatelliglobosispora scoriae]